MKAAFCLLLVVFPYGLVSAVFALTNSHRMDLPEGIPEATSCPPGKQFMSCFSDCKNICNDEEYRFCALSCRVGCFCPLDSIEVDGVCVPKQEYCSSNKCPEDQYWNHCGKECFNSCDQSNCSTICDPGCYCRKPSQIKVDGKCVDSMEHCGVPALEFEY